MLMLALALFVVDVFAAVLAFGGIITSETGLEAARCAFFLFLVGYVVALVAGLFPPRRRTL